jgi:hypothetical protein
LPYIAIYAGIHVFQNAWVALFGFHLALLPGIITQSGANILKMKRKVPLRILIPLMGIGLLAGFAAWLVYLITGIPHHLGAELSQLGITKYNWVLFVAYFILVNPWMEELYWRNSFGSTTHYLAFEDLFFAGYHLIILSGFVGTGWLWITFCLLSFVGWLWRQVTDITSSLLPATLSHFTADFSLVLAFYFLAAYS